MADIMNGRYALADPSSGLTVLSFEGGELNMFGSCTRIRTTQRDFYPQIQDEPTELKVENHIMAQLVTGLVVAAALAAVAVAVVVTGGAALAPLACALGGAAIGAGAVAIGTAVSDLETGYNRSWGDYWQRMITGSSIGFMAGASVYGLIAAVPAAASAAGVQASMMLGTSTFTAVTVPSIVTAGGYGLAAAGGIYTANDIYSNSRGYNIILDKVFDNNIEAYEATGMVLDLFAEMYTNLGESNRALGNRSDNDAGQPGEEPPKKLSDMGDNDSAAGETAKENNIKNTVNNDNVKTETTKDNSIKNPVESDNTAAGTTQGNGAKSIIENKGAETADGDAPHIEIKDKNSKQDVPETDAQEDIKVRKYSYNGDNAADDKDNKKSSVNLGKGEDSTVDKSSEGIEGGGAEKRGKNNKGADEEGIVIEQVDTNIPESREKSLQYSGKLIKVNAEDPAADALAKRIGGEARVRFANDPKEREFDAISPDYVAQAKPDLKSYGKKWRNQTKATFEAAKETGRKAYFQFEGTPDNDIIRKIDEYSKRYGVEYVIDTTPVGIQNKKEVCKW